MIVRRANAGGRRASVRQAGCQNEASGETEIRAVDCGDHPPGPRPPHTDGAQTSTVLLETIRCQALNRWRSLPSAPASAAPPFSASWPNSDFRAIRAFSRRCARTNSNCAASTFGQDRHPPTRATAQGGCHRRVRAARQNRGQHRSLACRGPALGIQGTLDLLADRPLHIAGGRALQHRRRAQFYSASAESCAPVSVTGQTATWVEHLLDFGSKDVLIVSTSAATRTM